jgi:hypothetical protein
VERLHDRDADLPGGGDRGQAAGPEVGVDDLGQPLGVEPLGAQPLGEIAHVRQQLLGRQRHGGTGGDVHDAHSLADLHDGGQVGVVAAGVDPDVVAQLGQCGGELGHVALLHAGGGRGGQRARVFGDHRDAHGSSSNSLIPGERPELRLRYAARHARHPKA